MNLQNALDKVDVDEVYKVLQKIHGCSSEEGEDSVVNYYSPIVYKILHAGSRFKVKHSLPFVLPTEAAGMEVEPTIDAVAKVLSEIRLIYC